MVTLEEELANSDLNAATDKSLNFRSEGGEGLYFSRGKVFWNTFTTRFSLFFLCPGSLYLTLSIREYSSV